MRDRRTHSPLAAADMDAARCRRSDRAPHAHRRLPGRSAARWQGDGTRLSISAERTIDRASCSLVARRQRAHRCDLPRRGRIVLAVLKEARRVEGELPMMSRRCGGRGSRVRRVARDSLRSQRSQRGPANLRRGPFRERLSIASGHEVDRCGRALSGDQDVTCVGTGDCDHAVVFVALARAARLVTDRAGVDGERT